MTRHAFQRLAAITTLLLMPHILVSQDSAVACTVRAETPRRVELPDGRTVSVDVQHVAVSGGSVMAVGRNAYVFPKGANPVSSPDAKNTFVGFVIDSRGKASLIASPFPGRTVRFPRVAAARDGFHVLFATGDDSLGTQVHVDSATLWYARYTSGRWTGRERVAELRDVRLASELGSELLARGEELAFLFPFNKNPLVDWSGGSILVQRRNGVWSADTLRAMNAPDMARALYDSSGNDLVAVFSQFAEGRPHPMLFHSRFNTTWRAPAWLAGDGLIDATMPVILRSGDDVVVSWSRWHFGQPQTASIEWLRLDRGGRSHQGAAIEQGVMAYPFNLVTLNDQRPLWLFHGDTTGNALALATAAGMTPTRLGVLAVPFDNPTAKAVQLSGSRLMAFTMKRGRNADEPMVASYTTVIEIRCPGSVQRE